MSQPSWWKAELTLTGLVQLAAGLVTACAMWFAMDKRISMLEMRYEATRTEAIKFSENQVEFMKTLARVVAVLDERKKL